MGRKWHQSRGSADPRIPGKPATGGRTRIRALIDRLRDLAGQRRENTFSGRRLEGMTESDLEDILAFESVGSGPSLFEGLERHGLRLPPPDELNERQCIDKVQEVANALLELQIVLLGFEGMSPRELYATLWNQTLWEACYVKKRNPGALTLIDVSRRMSRAEIESFLDGVMRRDTIQ